MIQRIQSIWLLLITILALLTFKIPFYVGTHATGAASYSLTAHENYILTGLTLAIGIISFFTIFLFKKRNIQIWLCIAVLLLELAVLFLYYQQTKTFTAGAIALWSLVHVAIIVLCLMAAKAIRKDSKLIKDSDRLR